MALADYRLCDLCESKAFYDANLNNDFDAPEEEYIRDSGYALDNLGDWAVLCKECAKTHKCTIEEIK